MRFSFSTVRCPTAPASRPLHRACRLAALLVTFAAFILWSLAPGPAAALSDADLKAAKAAFAAIRKNHWKTAYQHAADAGDPLVARIVRWIDYTRSDTDAEFASIAAFLDAEPAWPGQTALRYRAEEKMPATLPPAEVLAWFKRFPPLSTDGMIRYAAALLASGNDKAGREAVRRAWIEGDFGKGQEKHFYRQFRSVLAAADHRARLERLLWEDRHWQAHRILYLVDAGTRALAEARIALMRSSGGVDRAVNRVPAKLKNDPGLTYERLRWRRKKGRYESARELLDDLPAGLPYPRKWWVERDILSRRALDDGFITDAYRIAKNHGIKPTEAYALEYSEAEWLAGWIALRLLGDYAVAMDHFVAMYQIVQYPISRARGAYWTARAAEAMEIPRVAKLWYAVAARQPTTFYGQLALARLAPGGPLQLPAEPQADPEEVAAFKNHTLTRVIEILADTGEETRIKPFMLALAQVSDSGGWQSLVAELAHRAKRPDLGVQTAKNAERDGHVLLEDGYPAVDLPPPISGAVGRRIETALAHAVIRQESAFWPGAVSSAGARGLMQLMPATAKYLAKTFNVAYARDRLTEDPGYNLKLGTTYLAQMIDDFGGSYVLALAAYNAGPSRARQWARDLGRPGPSLLDAIDWIESIPFGETRSYIQRVLENLQMYRTRLGSDAVPLALERDLLRPSDGQSG